jgi:FAD/FMN-containing dehydrogenase
MRIFGYVKVALFTTVNILLNGATLGRYVWLEGRVKGGVFTNWAGRFRYGPRKFVKPTTEEEIVELIKNARRVRVFGSGHSFNSGVVSDETLVSLDDYSGLVWKDLDKKQVAAKGGYTGTGRRCSTARRRAGLQGTTFPRRPEHRGSPVDRRARDGEGVGVRQ